MLDTVPAECTKDFGEGKDRVCWKSHNPSCISCEYNSWYTSCISKKTYTQPFSAGSVNEIKTSLDKLIDDHWSYVKAVIELHDDSDLDTIEFHYKSTFRHGWKHAKEDK